MRAFNAIGFAHAAQDANRPGEPLGVPIAGDDQNAIELARRLIKEIGFEPVLVGGLAKGKYLVPGTPLAGEHTPGRDPADRRDAAREPRHERSTMTSIDPPTAVAPAPAGAASRLLQRLVAVRPEEVRAVSWCWLYIFAVLSSYYIMRPIRDQMGIAGGVKNLPWLFLGTLAGMVLVNLPFAYLVKKLPRSRFIPLTYRFFAANILLFAVALHLAGPEQTIWVGRIFFIWVSVYNLFVVSVFWQLNVDLFSPEQGKRLFGFIAAGATLGALVGSSITATLALYVSPTFLLIGAALLLEAAVFCGLRASPSCRRACAKPRARRSKMRSKKATSGRSAVRCSRACCTRSARPTS